MRKKQALGVEANMSIRLATHNDVEQILRIEYVCFPEEVNDREYEALIRKTIRLNTNGCWVFEEFGEVVSFLISEVNEGVPYVWGIATLPSHRGRGIATAMLREFEKYYISAGHNSLWLHVNVHNPAQKVYFDEGYRIFSFLPNFYGNLGHGVAMRKIVHRNIGLKGGRITEPNPLVYVLRK